jgi:hypothetical protein
MRYALNREDYLHRKILPRGEAFPEIRHNLDAEFLIETDDLIELIDLVYGFEVKRRTLQLYSSPQLKLLPPPIHIGGHRSYYLNPEHTERVAVILHLSAKLFMSLKAISSLLRVFPERHYGLILKNVLTAQELTEFVETFGHGLEVKDFLFHKISRILEALDDSREHISVKEDHARELALFKAARELERWLHGDGRQRVRAAFYTGRKD